MFEAHFQTFEDFEGGVALTARLSAFREELARRKLTGFVIPRADQQQNEYVPPSEERLAWLTGFTGSAGMAIVLTREAAVFVDGRYTLQAGKQVDRKAWHIEPLVDPPPEHWLARHLAKGDRLGLTLAAHNCGSRPAGRCRTKAGAELVAVGSSPVDAVARTPLAAAGAIDPGPAVCRQIEPKLKRIRWRSASSASMRWCCRTPWPGLSTSAVPTSRIRPCRCPTRWCRRRPARCSSITASSPTPRATSRTIRRCRGPTIAPKLASSPARRIGRPRQRHRGRCAEPPDQGCRRQTVVGSDREPFEGGQNLTEIDGTRTAHHRDGGADALSGLGRPRGRRRAR